MLNFAAGEMGALPAVLIPIFVINNSWPYWLALSLSLLGALVLSVATEAFVIRPLLAGAAAHDVRGHDRFGAGVLRSQPADPRGAVSSPASLPGAVRLAVTVGTLCSVPGSC